MAIPESLLQFKNDSTFVEVKTDEQTYKKVYPELGISDGINIEVKSGISENAEIKDPTRRETKNKES
jgi:HlyD family secretion protein